MTFMSICRTCNARKLRGPEGKPMKYGRASASENARRKREEWQRVKEDPIRLAETREYHRIYMHAKRREAGCEEHPKKGPKVTLVASVEGAVDTVTGRRYERVSRKRPHGRVA